MIINLKGDLWSSDHAKVYDARKTEHSSKYERIATVGGAYILSNDEGSVCFSF